MLSESSKESEPDDVSLSRPEEGSEEKSLSKVSVKSDRISSWLDIFEREGAKKLAQLWIVSGFKHFASADYLVYQAIHICTMLSHVTVFYYSVA